MRRRFFFAGVLLLISISVIFLSISSDITYLPFKIICASSTYSNAPDCYYFKPLSIPPNPPIQVTCERIIHETGQIFVKLKVQNISTSTVHIFTNRRMPYLMRQGYRSLLLLQGINPPEPGILYNFIEKPITQDLPAGQVISREVSMHLIKLHDHYSGSLPFELHGLITVQCQVGWSKTPISVNDRISIYTALDWQQITEAKPIQVNLP